MLRDESIRQGIKEYSQWPTISQLYIGQEFIGGSDIMLLYSPTTPLLVEASRNVSERGIC